jgi:DNA-directed RNA polymerase subunit F
MIINIKPLHLAEVKGMIKDIEEKKELADYIKKFTKLPKDKADAMAEELRALENLKMKEEHVIKIVDFMPKDQEDLGKIFSDVSLDDKEANDILDIVKKY